MTVESKAAPMSSYADVDWIGIQVETSVTAGTPSQITLKIYAYNYNTSAWVELYNQGATGSDTRIDLTIETNPSYYVNTSTKKIKLKLAWSENVAQGSSWSAKADIVEWYAGG